MYCHIYMFKNHLQSEILNAYYADENRRFNATIVNEHESLIQEQRVKSLLHLRDLSIVFKYRCMIHLNIFLHFIVVKFSNLCGNIKSLEEPVFQSFF